MFPGAQRPEAKPACAHHPSQHRGIVSPECRSAGPSQRAQRARLKFSGVLVWFGVCVCVVQKSFPLCVQPVHGVAPRSRSLPSVPSSSTFSLAAVCAKLFHVLARYAPGQIPSKPACNESGSRHSIHRHEVSCASLAAIHAFFLRRRGAVRPRPSPRRLLNLSSHWGRPRMSPRPLRPQSTPHRPHLLSRLGGMGGN